MAGTREVTTIATLPTVNLGQCVSICCGLFANAKTIEEGKDTAVSEEG